MNRVYNFSAGPSAMPEEVLKRAADEMLDCNGSGMSVMEMSHRSAMYEDIIYGCEDKLRKLLNISDEYEVLFLQGGGSTQFAMVPMNLMTGTHKADYIVTGQWGTKAAEEGALFGDARVVASSKDKLFNYIPSTTAADFRQDADYAYICYNNTIYGTKFPALPDTGKVKLVCDMSSSILSEPVDVSKFALLYAGAQKNMGPAGLTVVMIRKDCIGEPLPGTPTMLRYDIHAKNRSMYNTPPTYSIYICGLMLDWLNDLGGLEKMHELNIAKANLLYGYLDQSKLFSATISEPYRSLMNVPFVTGKPDIDKQFLAEADAAGLLNLPGHRVVGGMRASIYNAMPIKGVQKLVDFMEAFEKKHQ